MFACALDASDSKRIERLRMGEDTVMVLAPLPSGLRVIVYKCMYTRIRIHIAVLVMIPNSIKLRLGSHCYLLICTFAQNLHILLSSEG